MANRPQPSLDGKLSSLFEAERTARRLHDELLGGDRERLLSMLAAATKEATTGVSEDESSLRLARIASLLGEMTGPKAVDLLIDVLASELPEARHAAGEALTNMAFDRFKDVALGSERALTRLADDSPALPELPFLLIEVPEPGVAKILGQFLAHRNADVVASAVEAAAELGDPSLLPALRALEGDARPVVLEDESGEQDRTTVGALAAEATEMLEAAVE